MSDVKLFESKKIRSAWHDAEQKWYFSVADVVEALTDTVNARDYIKKMRKRDPELNANWGTICTPLEMTAAVGKRRQAKRSYEQDRQNHSPLQNSRKTMFIVKQQ